MKAQRVRGSLCLNCSERPPRFSLMFCTQRCAAEHAVELFETTDDWAWCAIEGSWVNEMIPGIDQQDHPVVNLWRE